MKRILICIAVFLLAFGLAVALIRLASPARVVVTWETASEVSTAGFFLHRSQSPKGPFSPLDDKPVPSVGDPLVGAAYRYEDQDVEWGGHYYYQLEEVEVGGARNLHLEVVEGQAGLGWPWALVGGVLFGVVAVGFCWLLAAPQTTEP